ncbi:MAG: stage III sporulation protein AF [Butyrivibrio sp.]|nr:stage III sporulation protein AF [Butyrivibrio sp.]
MEYFVRWIKNIAIFCIISSLILNIIPGDKYKRYIKLFLGIVTVILLIKPIGSLTGLDGRFDELLQYGGYGAMSADLRAELAFADEERMRIITAEFEEKISADIKEYVESLGAVYIASKPEININPASDGYGSLERISVDIARGGAYSQGNIYVPPIFAGEGNGVYEDELIAIEIKNYLADFYNLEKRNIYVNISQ